MRGTGSWAAAIVVAAALAGGVPAGAVSGGDGDPATNEFGKGDRLLPTTAALLVADGGGPVTADNAEVGCSATLIGCRTVITAAHCVAGLAPAGVRVFLRHAGLLAVDDVVLHPRHREDDVDVAVLRLAAPVTGIAPTPVGDRLGEAALAGRRGLISGFGISSEEMRDAGIQRNGFVLLDSCAALTDGDIADEGFLCWRFAGPLAGPGHDANTCSGDSGGPLFVTVDGRRLLAGVAGGGSAGRCGDEEVSYNASLSAAHRFVGEHLAVDATAACGDLPAVGEPGTRVVARAARLRAGHELRWVFTVGAGTRELRLTLNGLDDGEFDPDLYLLRGAAGEASQLVCWREDASAFAACVVSDPVPGPWTAVVRAEAGAGLFQLTATAFGGSLTAVAAGGDG